MPSPAVAGFYVPGMDVKKYTKGEELSGIMVDSLTSIEGVIPYDFYSLKFCRPRTLDVTGSLRAESLGQIVWGEHLMPSTYRLWMMQPTTCRILECSAQDRLLSLAELQTWERRINEGYRGNLIIDNLPVVSNQTWVANRDCTEDDLEWRGFPLGLSSRCVGDPDGPAYINNHLAFTVQVNSEAASQAKEAGERYFVVGFYVVPHSIEHVDKEACGEEFQPPSDDDVGSRPVTTRLKPDETHKQVLWSYSVRWEVKTDIAWTTRWDAYLNSSFANKNARIHWLSIISSLIATLCLAGMVLMVLMRLLHKDFNRYNSPENEGEAQEEVGWKLVHADVFRAPSHLQAFAIAVGTGLQLNGMFWVSLFFALLGFLHPAHRGSLLTVSILLFVLMAFANGFAVGTIQIMFDRKEWKWVFASGLLYPGLLFLLWGLSECLLSSKHAANAVPAVYVVQIAGLWFGVSLPLVVLGASTAYRRAPIEFSMHVQQIPRAIPPQKWFLSAPFVVIAPGVVPFCAALLELGFICNSIWKGYVYTVFGFLALVAVNCAVLTGLTVVLIIYYQLVFENYHWWWSSLTIPTGMGLHFFLFSGYYYATQLNLRSSLAAFLYFEFAFAISTMIAIGVSFVGFVSAWIFVRRIYNPTNIRVD